jgi:Asp-tRNA(Asn)/Glu-tRNA(Gln) amidotransferase A subunit family amidase
MRSPASQGGTIAADLIEHSASELARLVRDGEVAARDVVEAHLERIAQVNDELNAIVTLRDHEAREEAARVDRAVRDGADLPLAGVPFTVKDVIAAGGVRMTGGTPFLENFVPHVDATAVARLREAGAVLLGKTNCPEFAMFGYTRNSLFGETRNPLGPVTVGGSSGGEAAAVATRCSALGLGTDFGGSVRWPAHCTGILALRPTAGRVPGTGQLPAPSLEEPLIPSGDTFQGRVQVIGPLARSVEDLELAVRVIAGPDGIDPLAIRARLGRSRDVKIASVAVWDGPASPGVRDDVIAVVRNAARALEKRGASVDDERPRMLERAVTLYTELRDLDRLRDLRQLVRGHEPEVGEDVRAAIAVAEEAERRAPDVDAVPLWEERDHLGAEFVSYLERHSVLLMPVATLPPYSLNGPAPSVNGREQTTWDVLAPCRLISLFGVPSVSVPFGASAEGLPIGVQVVGRPFREDQVLAVAHVLMQTPPIAHP